MGYAFAGTCHWRPFIAFAEDGKDCKHGSLLMDRDTVWSYQRKIAQLDRVLRVVYFDPTKVSRTTTQHQNAITRSMSTLTSAGWRFEERNWT